MDDFTIRLNEMLMTVYHNIMRTEEDFLQKSFKIGLTIREMHLIECVGDRGDAGASISEIADYLRVTRSSVTVAVGKLQKKGYLSKNGSSLDGRVVNVTLTRDGVKIYRYHSHYHLNMVRQISRDFNADDQRLLLATIDHLNAFFEKGFQ